MNKKEAKQIVNKLTALSLRNLARNPDRWSKIKDGPKELTKAGVTKVAAEMNALADKLDPGQVIEHEVSDGP